MLTRRAFLLHYQALKEYAELRLTVAPENELGSILVSLQPSEADYIWHFLRPYVCVIHESGRGYYLNREYGHIVSVQDIPNPCRNEDGIPALLQRCVIHETARNHQAASFTTPDWANQLPVDQFTTYWLY